MKEFMKLFGYLAVLVGLCLPASALTIEKLPLETQAARGANYAVTFTYEDLTETATNTAQSFTNSFFVPAKTSVRFVAMELNTAFDGTNTLYTNSIALIVGDGNDDNIYLESAELHEDGTEVWYKFGPPFSGTGTVTGVTGSFVTGASATNKGTFLTAIATSNSGLFGTAITLQYSALADSNGTFAVTNVTLTTKLAMTNLTVSTDTAYTNLVLAEELAYTNATGEMVVTELGRYVYTADDYVDFKFTPSGSPYAGEALAETTAGSVTLYFDLQPTE